MLPDPSSFAAWAASRTLWAAVSSRSGGGGLAGAAYRREGGRRGGSRRQVQRIGARRVQGRGRRMVGVGGGVCKLMTGELIVRCSLDFLPEV